MKFLRIIGFPFVFLFVMFTPKYLGEREASRKKFNRGHTQSYVGWVRELYHSWDTPSDDFERQSVMMVLLTLIVISIFFIDIDLLTLLTLGA